MTKMMDRPKKNKKTKIRKFRLARLKRSKKAMIFNIAVVISVIIVLVYGFIRLGAKENVDMELGENPSLVMLQVQQGEKALIFLDIAAKLAMDQALFDLQKNGGISSPSACGTYYGFNMWNSESGATCYLDTKKLEATLENDFEKNLIARMAAYPDADFLLNAPGASNFVKQASSGGVGLAQGTGGAQYCSGSQDDTIKFTYPHESGWFPENGVKIWIPAEAYCTGSYPLIIHLHGCQEKPTLTPHFGDGDKDVIPLIKDLYKAKRIQPAIFAAPSQTVGDGWRSNPKGVCVGSTGALWGTKMDFRKLVDLIKQNLPQGITISSVSFTGHSGAGCGSSNGLHRALQQVQGLYAVGQFDTCVSASLGSSYKKKIQPSTKLYVLYGRMSVDNWDLHDKIIGANKDIACPAQTIAPDGGLEKCKTDGTGRIFSARMKNRVHANAVRVGMEDFLLKFFSAGQTATVASGGVVKTGRVVCKPGLDVATIGDSITADGLWQGTLKSICPGMSYKKFATVGWQTQAIIRDHLGRALKSTSPSYDVVIIHAGVNDLSAGQSAEHIIHNLQKMYSDSKAAGKTVIATTIMPWKGYPTWSEKKQSAQDKVNQWVKTRAKDVDVVVDLQAAMSDEKDPQKYKVGFSNDHLHPNRKGYDIMAQTIFAQAFTKKNTQSTANLANTI